MHQKALGGWALPGPAGEPYSAPPNLLAGFKGALLLREGRGSEERVKGRGGERPGSFLKLLSPEYTYIILLFYFTLHYIQ